MSSRLSIIIPCYNSEKTLEETLNSVYHQDYQQWEAIIVNDGSPDNLEEIALNWVKRDNRFKYFKKENGGLASARNYGIEKSNGIYILPLDSDNKIVSNFSKNAISVFEQKSNINVIYGNAQYFGEKEGVWNVGKFDKYKLLQHNYIDACAIIKKEAFNKYGLYDAKMPYQGHEDWEFWLRLIKNSSNFYYLNEITFYYRVLNTSMIRQFNENMLSENINYLQKKYYDLFVDAFNELLFENVKLTKEINKGIKGRIVRKVKTFFNL